MMVLSYIQRDAFLKCIDDSKKVKSYIMTRKRKEKMLLGRTSLCSNPEQMAQQLEHFQIGGDFENQNVQNVIGNPYNNEENVDVPQENEINNKPSKASHMILSRSKGKENNDDFIGSKGVGSDRRVAKAQTNIEADEPIEFETLNKQNSHLNNKFGVVSTIPKKRQSNNEGQRT